MLLDFNAPASLAADGNGDVVIMPFFRVAGIGGAFALRYLPHFATGGLAIGVR